mmetsp:Transcript_9853/g.31023  ORF Transcript_9853/g.31023 Transcript_9853/m.31023 type:complete len:95 (-) Transcript_9853:103-387(-)
MSHSIARGFLKLFPCLEELLGRAPVQQMRLVKEAVIDCVAGFSEGHADGEAWRNAEAQSTTHLAIRMQFAPMGVHGAARRSASSVTSASLMPDS